MQNPDSKETTDATGGHIKLNVDRRQQQRRLRLRLRHWRRPGGSNSLDTTTSATATAKATATITRAITTAVTTTKRRTTLINNPRRAAQNLGAFLDRILIAIRTHNPASVPQSWATATSLHSTAPFLPETRSQCQLFAATAAAAAAVAVTNRLDPS